MPMYMDIHEIKGATADAVAKAHEADVKVQGKYGVEYHKYWVNESCGKIFCPCIAKRTDWLPGRSSKSHPRSPKASLAKARSIARARPSFREAPRTSATPGSG